MPYLLPLLLLLFGFVTVHAQCKLGDILIGEDAKNYYCSERSKYEGSAAQRFASHACRAKQAVAADQAGVRALGFALDSERFTLFENVANEQREELKGKEFDTLLDQGLETTQVLLDKAASLNPWNVNDTIAELKARGFGRPLIVAALRRIALQKDKPSRAFAYRDFVEVVNSAREGWRAGANAAQDANGGDCVIDECGKAV